MAEDTEVRKILERIRTIAVVGCSKDPAKDAHRVPKYMQMHGYRIIPVNPTATEILGEKAYPSLDAVPVPYDAVDIFRPSADVPPIVDQAIKGPGKVIWMQLGIRNEGAAQKARAAGKIVVQDRCMMPAKAWTGISIHSAPSLGNSSRNTSSPRPSSAARNDARPSLDSQTRPSRVPAETTAWSSQARSWTRGIDALRVQRTFARSWYPSRSAFASGDFVPPARWALSRAAATAGWDVSTVWKSTTRRSPRHPMGPATVPAEKRVSADRRGSFLRSRGSDATQFSAGRPTSLRRPV